MESSGGGAKEEAKSRLNSLSRWLLVVGGVLLPVLLVHGCNMLVGHALMLTTDGRPLRGWMGGFEWVWGLTVFFFTPYFVGILAAFIWWPLRMPAEKLEQIGFCSVLLWIIPFFPGTFGGVTLFVFFFYWLFIHGLTYGNAWLERRLWREWLGVEVPVVEQRSKRNLRERNPD